MNKKPGLRAKLLLLASSLVFLALLGLVGEVACRLFGNATLAGNSRNLFRADAYGKSKGNTPHVEAISMGEPVHTDRFGFRVPANHDESSGQAEPAVLLLGDSVAFGTGVEEERTFAGLLRQSLTGQQVYNAAVIGWGVPNYLDFVTEWLPEHPEVQVVVLFFCLNDVSLASAAKIDAALGEAQREKNDKPAADFVQAAKRIGLISGLNEFFRSRSKLYLTLRNTLTDPQKRYWEADKAFYRDPEVLSRTGRGLIEVAEVLAGLGIRFTVVITPHEYQVRRGVDAADLDMPQRKIESILEEAGIEYLDLLPVLRARDEGSDLFLGGDPMHFSAAGHAVVHEVVLGLLESDAG